MSIPWADLKEAFFAIGSVAGVLAFFRPVIESKYQRDVERLRRIFGVLPEQTVVDLEPSIYQSRMVPSDDFAPFAQLTHEVRTNQDGVRFIGPYQKPLRAELIALLSEYRALRELIQVPYWEPDSHKEANGTTSYFWNFNKAAFEDANGVPKNYAAHLDACVDRARAIHRAYQRLQIVGELHLLEAPLRWWLLPRRFRANNVG